MDKPRYARRRKFINPRFQTSFILKFCLILILGCLVSVALTYMTTSGTLTSTYADSRLTIQNTSMAIMPSVITTNLITTGVLSVIAILLTLVVSHKIAGPMFRFEKDIHRIAAGDLSSRIHIRSGDQFEDVVVSLNHMIDSLNTSLSAIRTSADAVAAKAEQLNAPDELIREIRDMQKTIETRFTI